MEHITVSSEIDTIGDSYDHLRNWYNIFSTRAQRLFPGRCIEVSRNVVTMLAVASADCVEFELRRKKEDFLGFPRICSR